MHHGLASRSRVLLAILLTFTLAITATFTASTNAGAANDVTRTARGVVLAGGAATVQGLESGLSASADWGGNNPLVITVVDDNPQPVNWYPDFDIDGFGDELAPATVSIVQPGEEFVTNNVDCDDGDALVFPGATEVPNNGIDEDCNGQDLRQRVNISGTVLAGSEPLPGVAVDFDSITDSNGKFSAFTGGQLYLETLELGSARPPFELFIDDVFPADPDNVIIELPEIIDLEIQIEATCLYNDAIIGGCGGPSEYEASVDAAFDSDGRTGFWLASGSTTAGSSTIRVFVTDFSVNVSDNGAINERVQWDGSNPFIIEVVDATDIRRDWYPDEDEDGFGDRSAAPLKSLEQPAPNYVEDRNDCNDADPDVFPGAPEVPNNGIDEDCDGEDLREAIAISGTVLAGKVPLPGVNVNYGQDVTDTNGAFSATTYGQLNLYKYDFNDQTRLSFQADFYDVLQGPDDDTIVLELPPIVDLEIQVETSCQYNEAIVAGCDDVPDYRVYIESYFNLEPNAFVFSVPQGVTTNGIVSLETFERDFYVSVTLPSGYALDVPWDGTNPFVIDVVDYGDGRRAWYPDLDGDRFGDSSATPFLSVIQPDFTFVQNNSDCDDTDAAINPWADEVLGNDVDENCDGELVEPPVVTAMCLGSVVTIDMRTGASGTGTSGNDVILGTSGDDVIKAGAGNDKVCAGLGDDVINAGSGNDVVIAGGGDDRVYGLGGNDDLRGWGGDDIIRGGDGRDVIVGGSGDDDLAGGKGDDEVRGQTGDDFVHGNRGVDLLVGDAGNDELVGGPDGDTLRGGTGDDELRGQEGDDLLVGGMDNDLLLGGDDDDRLVGGTGVDRIFGGAGIDSCTDASSIDIVGNCESRVI